MILIYLLQLGILHASFSTTTLKSMEEPSAHLSRLDQELTHWIWTQHQDKEDLVINHGLVSEKPLAAKKKIVQSKNQKNYWKIKNTSLNKDAMIRPK